MTRELLHFVQPVRTAVFDHRSLGEGGKRFCPDLSGLPSPAQAGLTDQLYAGAKITFFCKFESNFPNPLEIHINNKTLINIL
jgi:hypothetical protein